MAKGKNTFYGWVIVVAGLIITGAGVGIYNNCNSVFIKPVCDALGFARGQFTLYTTITMAMSTLLMPFYGQMFRKHGVKRFMLMSSVFCGLVPIGYSFATQLWHFYLLAFFFGCMFNGVSMMVVGTLVSNWFGDKKGFATGIAYSGSGLVAAFMIPVVNRVIDSMGWQWGYRLIGITGMVILVPTILLLVKNRPEDIGQKPYTEGEPAPATLDVEYTPVGLTREAAMKTPALWLLLGSFVLVGLCGAGSQNHAISYLTDIGYTAAYASAVASTQMLVMTAGKIILGVIFDRFGPLAGSAFVATCCVGFPLLALMAGFPGVPFLFAALLGFGCAGGTVPTSTLTSSYFGDRDFAAIFSLCSMASNLGVAISTPLMGTIYDLTGSYQWAWIFNIGVGLALAACLFGAYAASRKVVGQFFEESPEIS